MAVEHDPDVGADVGPFMMAMINTKNVHRSNALLGHRWGTDFKYDEMSIVVPGAPTEFTGMGPDAPKPGEGPSKAEREAGFYDIVFIGIADDGRKVKVSVKGDRDPGYGSTSKMLAEAAICLVKDAKATPGGVWTPGAAWGRSWSTGSRRTPASPLRWRAEPPSTRSGSASRRRLHAPARGGRRRGPRPSGWSRRSGSSRGRSRS